MLNLLLLLLLLQDRPIDASIEAFLKGDAAARSELVKLGAYAIRPLQKAREKGPEKIDTLVFELKKAAAHPKGSPIAGSLTKKLTKAVIRVEPEVAVQFMETADVPMWLDWVAIRDQRFPVVTVSPDFGSLGVALDQLCRQTGLDYGFFHNTVVISLPERLWPSKPPPTPARLGSDELNRARVLVTQLGDESIEARESASRELLRLGPPVIALLEVNLSGRDSEVVARCAALIEKLRAPAWVTFGPPAAQRMKGSREISELLAKLQETQPGGIGISSAVPFSNLVDYLMEISGVRFVFRPVDLSGMTGFVMRRPSIFDQLCLNLQTHGLDFVIQDGRGIIDTREAIERTLPKEK